MPKSSTDSLTPSARSSCIRSAASCGSATTTPSVSSSVSRSAATPVERRTAATSVTNPPSCSVFALILTDTPTSPPRRCQPWQAVSACRRTVLVSWPISPAASASGTNSSGEMLPSAGCVQRASASTPVTVDERDDTLGWKATPMAPEASASRSAITTASRRCPNTSYAGSHSTGPPCASRALYIAVSARRSSVEASEPCSGASTQPTDSRMCVPTAPSCTLPSTCARSPRPNIPASPPAMAAGTATAKRPPPMRPISADGEVACSRLATSRSSSSPTRWPRVALTSRNESTATAASTTPSFSSSIVARSCVVRRRFGSPVIGSVEAARPRSRSSRPRSSAMASSVATVSSNRRSFMSKARSVVTRCDAVSSPTNELPTTSGAVIRSASSPVSSKPASSRPVRTSCGFPSSTVRHVPNPPWPSATLSSSCRAYTSSRTCSSTGSASGCSMSTGPRTLIKA